MPLRFQDKTLGAMNLFSIKPAGAGSTDRTIARALAEVATVAILGQRTIRRFGEVAEQLQTALNSRVIVEQAKGMLAQQGNLEMAPPSPCCVGMPAATTSVSPMPPAPWSMPR